MNDIDLGAISNFTPIGTNATPFTGKLFGNGHVISNLKINSAAATVGLFGSIQDATIRDVTLINANVKGTAAAGLVGALTGTADGASEIKRVHVTGRVACAVAVTCDVGGIAGKLGDTSALSASWSSADVTGTQDYAGGAVGKTIGASPAVDLTYATGGVTCGDFCYVGGLIGQNQGVVTRSFASGPVSCGANCHPGGLIGFTEGTVRQSFALGSVSGGSNAIVGGLLAIQNNGTTTETFSAGAVSGGSGANVGGWNWQTNGFPTLSNDYYDSITAGTAVSGSGLALTTTQFRTALPGGFSTVWALSKNLGYPYLNERDIDFAAPLATIIASGKILTFLPISQLDKTLYGGSTSHIDQASLAIVYTMIARAAGISFNVGSLKNVKPNKYFWKDSTQTTTFKGPVTDFATLGTLKNLAANKPIASNITGPINQGKLVILRGTFTKTDGGKGTHYMLATMYAKDFANKLSTVVANDPWTGSQVEIDPASKIVLTPHFPLEKFKVDGYQPVTIN